MSADDFFSRWSRRKQEAKEEGKPAAEPAAPAAPAAPAEELPPPTLDDVAALSHDADFRRFVAPGVDEAVRRSAMKKLFTDPHFNVMDGLDIYIDDYNKFEPLPAAMLAMLEHAKPLLDPLAQLKQPGMRMLDLAPEPAPPADEAQEAEAAPASDAAGNDVDQAPQAEAQTDTADAGTAAEGPPADPSAPTSQDDVVPEDEHPI
jgi:Protein of unknown function (DUF3306)